MGCDRKAGARRRDASRHGHEGARHHGRVAGAATQEGHLQLARCEERSRRRVEEPLRDRVRARRSVERCTQRVCRRRKAEGVAAVASGAPSGRAYAPRGAFWCSSPQQSSVPSSARSPHVPDQPELSAANRTPAGTESWPLVLSPQHITVLSVAKPHVWYRPALSSLNRIPLGASVWWKAFQPQHSATPVLARSPHACPPPTTTVRASIAPALGPAHRSSSVVSIPVCATGTPISGSGVVHPLMVRPFGVNACEAF